MLSFDFAVNAMNIIGADREVIEFFIKMSDKINCSSRLSGYVSKIRQTLGAVEHDRGRVNEAYQICDELADAGGFNPYSAAAFAYIASCDILHEKYREHGISDEIFYDTLDDIRCKINECRAVYGVIGCFVREWEFPFFGMDRFALGRMQYELAVWEARPVILGKNAIYPGDKFINVHIPSSGKPFDKVSREASYKKAVEFYRSEFDGNVPIGCWSWLLDPMLAKALPNSNIADFSRDFDVVIGEESVCFEDSWRVFGAASSRLPSELPEDTALQLNCKQRLLSDDKFYHGRAIMFKKI